MGTHISDTTSTDTARLLALRCAASPRVLHVDSACIGSPPEGTTQAAQLDNWDLR